MKRVSFKVAKALKEVGYPQDYKNAEDTYTNLNGDIWVKPTYLEVWLWLWIEKNIFIQVGREYITLSFPWTDSCTFINYSPEDGIITAIEYLVDNDLIK